VVPDGFPRGCLAPLHISGRTRVADARTSEEEHAVTDVDICSAKGCQQPATWELLWNNPKLHTPDRRKTWLACDDHKQSLSEFLGARQFLKDVVEH
jgi:hypothetical protein